MTWPVLVINLERSTERWTHMQNAFSGETLARIVGVDGSQWQDASRSRPRMSVAGATSLVSQGVLCEGEENTVLKPGEIGCALGHRAAWEWIVANDPEYAIVLEDDIQVGGGYVDSLQNSIELQGGMPDGADVLFLSQDDGFGRPNLNSGLLDRKEGPNYGYLISPAAAQAAIDSQFPMFLNCAEQWKQNISMHIVGTSIIRMDEIGLQTCMDYLGE